MDFENFLRKQNKIYAQISNSYSDTLANGIISDLSNKREDGYIVLFRHSPRIAKQVSVLSNNIAEIVPSLVYTPQRVHTTIFTLNGNFDPKTLDLLHDVIKETSGFNSFIINFNMWLVTRDAVVAAGQPDKKYFTVVDRIISEVNKRGLKIHYPKMAHITVTRFTKKCTDKKKLRLLFDKVNNQRTLGVSNINIIEAAYIKHSGDGFESIGRITKKLI